ncbi:MAG: GNAT family N-acetyltransferase [Thermoprotei archaeon]|nr:MAG: GNAT family N-acetyltransferase [Thermoprotei archaeon]
MPVEIRLASLDDVKGIVEVYCSDVDKWYKFINGRKIEARYEDLSIIDKSSHGGPWMSIETCSIHLNYVLISNQYPLVALLNDRVVGELELYIGYEQGLLGKTGFIDVLQVHKDYRGQGIGRSLIMKARDICIKHDCDTLSVWPEKNVIDFYKKCGLNDVAYNIYHIEIDLGRVGEAKNNYTIDEFPEKYDVLSYMVFISPRIFSSFTAWIKSRWDFAFEKDRIVSIEGYIREVNTAFIIESLWNSKDVGRLMFWIEDINNINEAMDYLFHIAINNGFKRLALLVSYDVYEEFLKNYPHEIIDKELLLMEKLK